MIGKFSRVRFGQRLHSNFLERDQDAVSLAVLYEARGLRAKQGNILEWFLLATSWVPVVVMPDLRTKINHFGNNLKNVSTFSVSFRSQEKNCTNEKIMVVTV